MNKSAALLLVLVFLTASCLITLSPANADSKTIVVPDDYPTIAAAIGNATDGDTVFVKKGIYEYEALVINKKLSLIGEDAKNTKINLHPPLVTTTIFTQTFTSYASPIKIEANDVKLSGFTIDSDGGDIFATGDRTLIKGNIITTGLSVNGDNQTITENTLIANINCGGSYCSITANTVVKGTIGVTGSYNSILANNVIGTIGDSGSSNIVFGNTVKDGNGIWACVGNIVAKNIITNCSQGVNIGWGFDSIICGNIITNNRGAGLTKIEGLNNTFYANYVANNAIGITIGVRSWQHTGNTTFYHNNFINNTQQTQVLNLDHTDYWDNGEEGNYWSNYTGSDANGNGIGDTPYVIFGDSYHTDYPGNDYLDYTIYGDSYEDRYPLMASFNVSSITIELPEWATDQLLTLLPSLDTTPPTVSVLSPENKTYPSGNLSLTFAVSEPTSWIGYSIDGQENVTVAGNTILVGLAEGSHNLIVYVKDMAGNTGVSEMIHFTITTESTPLTYVAVAIASVAVVGAGLLVYFRKIRRSTASLSRKQEKVIAAILFWVSIIGLVCR